MTMVSEGGVPIRIVFCHFTSDICGGSDQSLFDLVTHLNKDHFQAKVILKTGDPMADAYRAAGVLVREIMLVPPRRALEIAKLLRFAVSFGPSVYWIAHEIRQAQADIVHVNTSTNLQAPIAAWLARRPIVWHVREIGKASLVDRTILMLIRLLATRVVAISRAVASTLRACGNRVRIIYNGIDLTKYESFTETAPFRRDLDIDDDSPVVVCVGRLEPWKGQHVLVEAVPVIVRRFPAVRIVFVGGPAANKPEYERSLRQRVSELGVQANVTFAGIRSDIPSILARSQVLVQSSVSPEPFGRTIIEAMASGCPVVAPNHGGPAEIVEDGRTGWLTPPGDAGALADRICALLSDPQAAQEMGVRGRAAALDRFSLARVVGEMEGLFREVIQA